MSKTKDWWPGTQSKKLMMAETWVEVLTDHGVLWNIPPELIKDFKDLTSAAANAYRETENDSTCTPVAHTKNKEAFLALTAAARNIKRCHFNSPPLKESELTSLHLKPKDPLTPIGDPTAIVSVVTFLVGTAQLGIKFEFQSGNPEDPANKGFRVFYCVRDAQQEPPENPKEFTESFFTRRKKYVMQFDYGDSGKLCYVVVQIENDGKKGPWGSMAKAFIP